MPRKRLRILFALALAPIVFGVAARALHSFRYGRLRGASFGEATAGPQVVAATHHAPPGSPNIIFILTDDLSLNLVQFMPHVLEMERGGATFTNYFVTDSLCCPSRSSIFTGEFPHNTGVFRNGPQPDGGYSGFNAHGNESRSFAVALERGGYQTAMLGKYLNGYDPVKDGAAMGWNEWDVSGWGYGEFNYTLNENGKVVHYGKDPGDYMTDVLSRIGVQFIERSGSAPFFIEVATFTPHAPYVPASRDAQSFKNLRAPRTPAFDAAPDDDAARWLIGIPSLSRSDKKSIDRAFRRRAQSVLAIDAMIGDLEKAVAASGQAKNTYFIFSSDNGLHMGEHRLMPGKMTAFDTDIHVPLIVAGPGVAAGSIFGEVTENIDLCPTFAELARTAIPSSADGRSLVSLLLGKPVRKWRSLALIEHHGPREHENEENDPDAPAMRSGDPPNYEAIRAPGWVYVKYADGTREYHDHKWDPDELRNTFSSLSPLHQEGLEEAVTALQACHGTDGCWRAASSVQIADGKSSSSIRARLPRRDHRAEQLRTTRTEFVSRTDSILK